jgi:hypothetical protein
MKQKLSNSSSKTLPIKQSLTLTYALSYTIAILMTAVSVGGFLFSSIIYPTDELRQSYVSNDLINLLIGLPILLGSMWLTRRGKLTGLLFWPGALLYVLYNYTAYVFGMPFGLIPLAFIALVLLSAYLLLALLKNIDKKAVQAQLKGGVSEKTTGWVLIIFGSAFLFRAIGMLVKTGTGQATLPTAEIGTLIADIVLSILWISGGVLLLRQRPLGYVSGLGLLFAASTLFIGLILYLLLQPVLTGTPFAFIDVVVVSIMGLVCFIPFGLFLRGVVSRT